MADPLVQRRATGSSEREIGRRSQVWETGPNWRWVPLRLQGLDLCDERRVVEYWQAMTSGVRWILRALCKDVKTSASKQ